VALHAVANNLRDEETPMAIDWGEIKVELVGIQRELEEAAEIKTPPRNRGQKPSLPLAIT
jgi:hypothetical protein